MSLSQKNSHLFLFTLCAGETTHHNSLQHSPAHDFSNILNHDIKIISPPTHTHTINNYRLLSIVDVWKKDEMVAPPQLPTHPKKLAVRERKTSRTAPIHCTGNRRFGITEFEGNQPKHKYTALT